LEKNRVCNEFPNNAFLCISHRTQRRTRIFDSVRWEPLNYAELRWQEFAAASAGVIPHRSAAHFYLTQNTFFKKAKDFISRADENNRMNDDVVLKAEMNAQNQKRKES
jgi:hypothetical protein